MYIYIYTLSILWQEWFAEVQQHGCQVNERFVGRGDGDRLVVGGGAFGRERVGGGAEVGGAGSGGGEQKRAPRKKRLTAL